MVVEPRRKIDTELAEGLEIGDVGVLDTSNNRINPATEDTLGSIDTKLDVLSSIDSTLSDIRNDTGSLINIETITTDIRNRLPSSLTAFGNFKVSLSEQPQILDVKTTTTFTDVVVSTTTPLGANATFTSDPVPIIFLVPSWGFLIGFGKIVGSVFTDQPGTLKIQQSNNGGINWDAESVFSITANTPTGFIVDVVGDTFRVVYTNGGTAQSVFRLFVRLKGV